MSNRITNCLLVTVILLFVSQAETQQQAKVFKIGYLDIGSAINRYQVFATYPP